MKITTLHETGAPTHYLALESLAKKNGLKYSHHSFLLLNKNKRLVMINMIKHPCRFIYDLLFYLFLPYIAPRKIVLGIAPYNNLLPYMMGRLSKHQVYYHTSFSKWDGSRYAYWPDNKQIFIDWHQFTAEYAKHIFSVTEWTKNQLVMNGFSTEDRISVVNHSYSMLPPFDKDRQKDNRFICVGHMTKNKGIEQLLDIFSSLPTADITFIGHGNLDDKVREYTSKYSNIHFIGQLSNPTEIIPYYNNSSFLILNSQRSAGFEELFGMVIVEAMSCGCVPITTDHPGPMEIIKDGVDGLICKEGHIKEGILMALEMSDSEYAKLRQASREKGEKYHCDEVADRWSAILS